MEYSIERLPNKRWGIYLGERLLASIGNHQTALKIITLLRKTPYQPQLSKNKQLNKSQVMAA